MVGINNKNLCVWLVVSPVLLPVCPPPSKVSSELELAALTSSLSLLAKTVNCLPFGPQTLPDHIQESRRGLIL